MNWKEASWLAIDTETTGLNPRKDRIVSVAVARKGAGTGAMKVKGWLVNPGVPIPPEATAVNGITNEMVAGCPTLRDIQGSFLATVARADVLVAYHWPFDDSMLLAGIGDPWEDAIEGKPVIDPLVVVRLDDVGRYWSGKGRHKLGNVVRKMGVVLPRNFAEHDAGSDAWMALAVLGNVLEHLPDDADEASAFIRHERATQDERFQAWLAKQPPLEDASPGGEGGTASPRRQN